MPKEVEDLKVGCGMGRGDGVAGEGKARRKLSAVGSLVSQVTPFYFLSMGFLSFAFSVLPLF
jgi:hypothetical protein